MVNFALFASFTIIAAISACVLATSLRRAIGAFGELRRSLAEYENGRVYRLRYLASSQYDFAQPIPPSVARQDPVIRWKSQPRASRAAA